MTIEVQLNLRKEQLVEDVHIGFLGFNNVSEKHVRFVRQYAAASHLLYSYYQTSLRQVIVYSSPSLDVIVIRKYPQG